MSTNGNGSEHPDRDTPESHPFVLRQEFVEVAEKVDGLINDGRSDRRMAAEWRRFHSGQIADLTSAVKGLSEAVFQLVALPHDVARHAQQARDVQQALTKLEERIAEEERERQDSDWKLEERVVSAEQHAKLAVRAWTMGSDIDGEALALARAQADAMRLKAEAEKAEAEAEKAEAEKARIQIAGTDSWRARKGKFLDKYAIPAAGGLILAAAGAAVALLQNCH